MPGTESPGTESPDTESPGPRRLGVGGWLLVVLFVVSGTLHLVRPATYAGIVPHVLPWPTALVLVSGVAELACAAGLLRARTRTLAAGASFVLLLAVLPANVQMAVDAWQDHRAGDAGAAYVVGTLVRLPLQLPLLWWAWRLTRRPTAISPRDG